MSDSSLVRKLKLKPGQRGAIINAPKEYLRELKPFPAGVQMVEKLDGEFDWLQIFVNNTAELKALAPRATRSLKPASLLWVSFPKGSSGKQTDLTRDSGWEVLQKSDLKWINLISVNETWSAFSMRPYKPGEKRESYR
jgi:hypothetical protein